MNKNEFSPEWDGSEKNDQFWLEELKKAGVLRSHSLKHVYIVHKAPEGMDSNFKEDLLLDGKYCDVYFTSNDDGTIPEDPTDSNLVAFIHIKEGYIPAEKTSFNPLSTDNWQSDKNQANAEKHEE